MIRFATALLAFSAFAFAEDVNLPAPELEVKMESGQIVKLSSLKGSPVLVEFFMTTCQHCQQSAASVEKMLRTYGPKGLKIVAVVTDDAQRLGFPEFRQKFGATYPMGVVKRDDSYRFFNLSVMKPFYVPSYAFIDKNGIMRTRFVGGIPLPAGSSEVAELTKNVEAIMKPAAPAAKASAKK